jgi:hypothetical protein
MREKCSFAVALKTDEDWNIHSYFGRDPFVDHCILYALCAGGNSTGKGQDDQEIRSRVGRFLFIVANQERGFSEPRGFTASRRTLSMEE